MGNLFNNDDVSPYLREYKIFLTQAKTKPDAKAAAPLRRSGQAVTSQPELRRNLVMVRRSIGSASTSRTAEGRCWADIS